MVEEGGRGKKKKFRLGDMDVCVCEGAVPGGRGLCHPSRCSDTWAGPSRAHCGSPSERRGHLLLEAVNFPPTWRAGGGRPREGLPGRRGRFCRRQKEVSVSSRAARCTGSRGDARLLGTPGDTASAASCARPDTPAPRRENALPFGEARDHPETRKKK